MFNWIKRLFKDKNELRNEEWARLQIKSIECLILAEKLDLEKKKNAAYLGVFKPIYRKSQEAFIPLYHNPLSQSQSQNHYGAYGGVLPIGLLGNFKL